MSLHKIREELGDELENIVSEFEKSGIIFESQFDSLYSMFCKKYTSQLIDILKQETKQEVSYGYAVPYFFYYDINRFSLSEATEIAKKYQFDNGNM